MNPSAGPSHAVGTTDDTAAAVALRGASLAFQKKPPPFSTSSSQSSIISNTRSSPQNNQRSNPLSHYRDNGALQAATSSVQRARSPGGGGSAATAAVQHQQYQPLAPQATGGSLPEVDSEAYPSSGFVAARLQQLGPGSGSGASAASSSSPVAAAHLGVGGGYAAQQLSPAAAGAAATEIAKMGAKSPSLIAATLAASRSVSPTPKAKSVRRSRSVDAKDALSAAEAVDSASIPPTNSLISMFEGSRRPAAESEEGDSKADEKPSIGQVMARDRVREQPQVKPVGPAVVSASVLKPRVKSKESAVRSAGTSSTPTEASRSSTSLAQPVQAATLNRLPKTVSLPTKVHSSTTPDSSPTQVTSSKNMDKKPDEKTIQNTSPAPHDHMKRSSTFSTLRGPKQPSPTRNIDRLANESGAKAKEQSPQQPSTPPRNRSPVPQVISRSSTNVLSPQPTRLTPSSLRTTTPPPPIILRPTSEKPSSPAADPEKRQAMPKQPPPTPPQPRKSKRLVASRSTSRSRSRARGHSDTRSTPISMYGLPIVTPSASQPKSPPPPARPRRLSAVSAPPSPTHEPLRRRRLTQPSSKPSSPPMHVDKLSNAIMAGSLASSRLTPHHTGSSLPPSSVPSRQRSPRLLHTLRQPHNGDNDDHDRQKKGHHHRHRIHSSKHMHHEGSRSKWREKITDRERRRYEGLWASNRGRLLTYESPATSIGSGLGTELWDCVANIVVREIWKRSRLPDDELAEVWNLVDRNGHGYLSRQEFVVGMWLIDQRLRGHKTPTKVGDSVWGSVNGVTILRPKGR